MSDTSDSDYETNINELPEKEFTQIFSLLPLPDLIPAELVCKKWRQVQRTVCSSISDLTLYVPENKRDRVWTDVASLHYMTGRLYHSSYTFADASLPIHDYLLNKREAASLKVKFPAVKSLQIFGLVFSFDSFTRLLGKWPNLHTLAFITDDFADGPTYSGHSIWNGIWKLLDSALPKLKHLVLPHEIRLDRFYTSATIGRLESLQIPIGIDTNGKQLMALFRAISSNPNLRRLTITNILKEVDTDLDDHEGFFDLEEMLVNVPSEVFSQLTHLGWHFLKGYRGAGVDEALLTFIVDHFTSLTHLDLTVSASFKELVAQLSKLPNLTSLRLVQADYLDDPADRPVLDSEFDKSDTERFEPSISTNPQRPEYKADYDRQYKTNQKLYFFFGLTPRFYKDDLVQMPQLQSLYLANLAINRWEAFDYLRYVFPNLTMINFERCELAVLKRMNNKRFVPRRKLLLDKLRLWSKLQKVYRNGVLTLEMSSVKNQQIEKALVAGKLKDFFRKVKTAPVNNQSQDIEN